MTTRVLTSAAEQLFWAEVRNPKATRRTLALCYAQLIAFQAARHSMGLERDETFWPDVNKALHDRLGIVLPKDARKVDYFRRLAWGIHEACTKIREVQTGESN